MFTKKIKNKKSLINESEKDCIKKFRIKNYLVTDCSAKKSIEQELGLRGRPYPNLCH